MSSLSRSLSTVVCVDHLFIGDYTVFHDMDSDTRYSAGCVVEIILSSNAILALEANWISQFWYPETILADQTFSTVELKNRMSD